MPSTRPIVAPPGRARRRPEAGERSTPDVRRLLHIAKEVLRHFGLLCTVRLDSKGSLLPRNWDWHSMGSTGLTIGIEALTGARLGLGGGIDAGFGDRARSLVQTARRKYGLDDTPYVFFPANPWPHKNHTRFLAAVRRCRDSLGLRVDVVCTGRLRNQTWTAGMLAEAADVSDQVRDLGFVPSEDVAGLMAGARFMVFPSFFEGFGIPVLEAMAVGCPVCAASCTSIPELLGDCGLLFDPASTDEIMRAIERMWQDANLREELARRGIERARRYQWEQVVPMLEDFYARAAGRI